MESDILKHFIGLDVEILVGGTWVEGRLQPLTKGGIVVLKPFPGYESFYGPASMKTDVIQAIRQLRKLPTVESPAPPPQQQQPQLNPALMGGSLAEPSNVRSSLDQNMPGQASGRFIIAK